MKFIKYNTKSIKVKTLKPNSLNTAGKTVFNSDLDILNNTSKNTKEETKGIKTD